MRKFRSRNSLEDINEEPSVDHMNQDDQFSSRRLNMQNSRNQALNNNDSQLPQDSAINNDQDLSDSGMDTNRLKREDPISAQQRIEMNQQIKQFQEKSQLEGKEAILRAQNLVQQIERQSKKRGIGEDDDKRQQYYQQLIRTKREYEEEYLKKTKEFYLTEGMDMNKIQNFIIENFEMNLQQQRDKLNEEIREREQFQELNQTQNKKLFPQRFPQVADVRSHFFRQSQEIFKPLKQIEIKQIYNEIKEKQKTMDVQEFMEPRAADRLDEHYYKTYQEWSNTQPFVEDQRNRLKELFAESFELASTLNNQPESMEKPLIWHRLTFSEKEKEIVDKWMKKKDLIKNNKYGFLEDDEEFEADDILLKVEKYLDTELFIQTYDKDDNVSDEELNKLQKKGNDEPYNENTIHLYDQNEESEPEH